MAAMNWGTVEMRNGCCWNDCEVHLVLILIMQKHTIMCNAVKLLHALWNWITLILFRSLLQMVTNAPKKTHYWKICLSTIYTCSYDYTHSDSGFTTSCCKGLLVFNVARHLRTSLSNPVKIWSADWSFDYSRSTGWLMYLRLLHRFS